MAYIVGAPCVNCKYGDCVEVCPVDCFYQDDDQLYINPAECIDCDACRPACPVDAIFFWEENPGYDETKFGPHRAPYYIYLHEQFPYHQHEPVTLKAEVENGPEWDEKVAEG